MNRGECVDTHRGRQSARHCLMTSRNGVLVSAQVMAVAASLTRTEHTRQVESSRHLPVAASHSRLKSAVVVGVVVAVVVAVVVSVVVAVVLTVGIDVGAAVVGVAVGIGVGCSVGVLVGANVGAGVGDRVGDMVVGAAVVVLAVDAVGEELAVGAPLEGALVGGGGISQ